jgi:Helix-turn-helix domain
MTVQFVEIAGAKMAMLPLADYKRLIDIAEDKADAVAAAQAERKRRDGEEYIPAEIVDRILSGESAIRVWRQFRGMTLQQLSTAASMSIGFLSQIELGQRRGNPQNFVRLATALGVSADDILPLA